MKLTIASPDRVLDINLIDMIERHVEHSLQEARLYVQFVKIRFSKVRAREGVEDTRCHVEVVLAGDVPLSVCETHADPQSALRRALSICSRLAVKRVKEIIARCSLGPGLKARPAIQIYS